MSQTTEILARLRAGHNITAIDALNEFQCFRLASRIDELRQDGHDIVTETIDLPTGKRIASYWLRGQRDMWAA